MNFTPPAGKYGSKRDRYIHCTKCHMTRFHIDRSGDLVCIHCASEEEWWWMWVDEQLAAGKTA
jgi:hypothetical protein